MPSSRFRKPRDPAIFPILFADTVERAQGSGKDQLLKLCKSPSEARSFLNVFRDWRYCLRNWPYPARGRSIELSMRIETYIEPLDGLTAVYLRVRPDPIATLVAHNPHLLPIVIDATTDNP